MIWLLAERILIDGAILTAVVAAAAVLTLYLNPRIALSDYPEDVKAAVPPRTKQELRQGMLISIPLLVVFIAIPLWSTWLVRQQNGGVITYWMAFVVILGEYLLTALFDLLVLDIWMFFTLTPKFLVIPGTEGMPGYKDWRPHARAHMTKGSAMLVVFSALLALIPALLY